MTAPDPTNSTVPPDCPIMPVVPAVLPMLLTPMVLAGATYAVIVLPFMPKLTALLPAPKAAVFEKTISPFVARVVPALIDLIASKLAVICELPDMPNDMPLLFDQTTVPLVAVCVPAAALIAACVLWL